MKPSERRERRRLRLKELIEQKFEGSQIAFSNKAGVPATLVSRYLSGLKGIGEDMRNKIEENTGFLGWLDNQDDSSAYSGAEIEETPLVSPGDSRLPIQSGPGKELLELLSSGALREAEVSVLTTTAKLFASGRARKNRQLHESAEFLPPVGDTTGVSKKLIRELTEKK